MSTKPHLRNNMKTYFKLKQITEAVANNSCAIATQEPQINLANKANAIQSFMYMSVNPFGENVEEYYEAIAQSLSMSVEDAAAASCANCAYNNQSEEMYQCISIGMGGAEAFNPIESIQKGGLGYCQKLHFITAGNKLCSNWEADVSGGEQPK
jgi:hypothetical protein